EEHDDTIRNMISFLVSDKSMVDDIFQDLFISLVRRPIPERVKNIKGYLHRAVKNDVLDAAFQTKSYRARNQKYAELYTDRPKCDTPENIVIQAEEIQRLFDIVENQLMQHEAEAVIQRYHYGRSTSEAAQAMNINKRSFSHYICTGLKKVRRVVRESQLEPNTPF
ncbi:unnamed protein product, partial [marine sediment metagenome]